MGARHRRVVGPLLAVAAATGAVIVTTAPPTPVQAVVDSDPTAVLAGGLSHQCAIRPDRSVVCWGNNRYGQLGDGTFVDSLTPVPVAGLADVVALDAGSDFTCALLADGDVRCWGDNRSEQMGTLAAGPFQATPISPAGLAGATSVAAGADHACAALDDGSARCWGRPDAGALGDGSVSSGHVPVAVSGLSDAVSVTAGLSFTCALRTGGTVSCWGLNAEGQYGDGTTTTSDVPTPIPGLTGVRRIDAGIARTCLVDASWRAWCTGDGPLGDGSTADSPTYVPVSFGPVQHVATGGVNCLLAADASVWCWSGGGLNLVAAAAGVFNERADTPQRTNLAGVTAVSTAPAHTCVAMGEVRCWGANIGGQLGRPETGHTDATHVFPGPDPASTLTTGFGSTCVTDTAGTLECAGLTFADFVAVEGDAPLEPTAPPAPVPDLPAVDAASFRFGHGCAVDLSDDVWCWGVNFVGETGQPAPTTPEDAGVQAPAPVTGIAGVSHVDVGALFSCAITDAPAATDDDDAWCWGSDEAGRLGDGPPEVDTDSPSRVLVNAPPAFVHRWLDLSVGNGHACGSLFISFSGTALYCWGDNDDGTVGDGTTTDRDAPVLTSPIIAIPKAFDLGEDHTCAIDGSDVLHCWGSNEAGKLGDGTPVDKPNPTPIALPGTPVDVALGQNHTCALLADGTVWCWGDNRRFQMGAPVPDDEQPTPGQVPGLAGVVDIEAGILHTCALLGDGSVRCWGDNTLGQAGTSPVFREPLVIDGVTPFEPAVVPVLPIWHPVSPARLADTRIGAQTADGQSAGGGAIRGDTQIEIPVHGRAGVPDDARFVVVNLTAVQPSDVGFLTAHACLSPRPVVSSLNYSNHPGAGPINLGNESIVELSPAGSICVYTSATTELTVDVTAWGDETGGYEGDTPARLLDSRPGLTTIDGGFELGERVAAGTEIELQVTGRAAVPGGAATATLFVAAVNPSGVGFVTAHPCLDEPPTASSLNFGTLPDGRGINRGNEVLAPLSTDGTVCLFVSTETDLTVDVVGSIGPATTHDATDPARLLDTRAGESTVDGVGEGGGPLAADSETVLQVTGRAGVPDDATSALLNVTAVRPAGIGFVTAHPCLADPPLASSLNFTSSPATGSINGGNEVLVPLSADGTVCLVVSETTHLTVDVVGSA